jgi:FixJ family two-component response regulator
MPGTNGFELLAQLAAAGHSLPTIIITGHGDIAMPVPAANTAGHMRWPQRYVAM